jgi:hypothetical protein
LIFKIIRKVARVFFGSRMRNLGFRFILPVLVRKVRKANAQWIFCPCDPNPFDLEQAVLLARACKLPLAVYLVDDFVECSRFTGNKEYLHVALRDVPGWIRSADKVFVISEGFRARVKELYGKDSTVLSLPFDLGGAVDEKRPVEKEHQIIFVGNLTHFYFDGIKAMAAMLDELNQTREVPLVLRLTLPNIDYVKKVVGDFKCIRCVPCQGLDDLRAEIAGSLMAFVPYSFDPQYKVMVQTSFPSKILSCLAASRYVLVYGPEDSSSVRYCRQHGLSEVIDKDDVGALRDAVLRQLSMKADHGEKYREVIQKEHASDKIAGKFLAGLNENKGSGVV